MEALKSSRALRLRTRRFASISATGVWLLAMALASIGVRAQEPDPAPRALPATPEALPPARPPTPIIRHQYGSYLFFGPGGRSTAHPPVNAAGAVSRPHPTRQPYLFFSPSPGGSSGHPGSGPGSAHPPAVPPPAPVPAVPLPEAGSVHPPGPRSFLFFTPKGDKARGEAEPPARVEVGSRPAPDLPAPMTVVEKVPVRVPHAKTRQPLPYLIFQPKDVKKGLQSGAPGAGTPGGSMTSASSQAPPRVAAARRAAKPNANPKPQGTRSPTGPPGGPGTAPPRAGTRTQDNKKNSKAKDDARQTPRDENRPRPKPAPPTYRLALENQGTHETIIPLPIPAIARHQALVPSPIVGPRGEGPRDPSQVLRIPDFSLVPDFSLPPLPDAFSLPTGRPMLSGPAGPPRWAPAAPGPIRLTGAEAELPRHPADPLAGRPRLGDAPARKDGP